MADKYEKAFDTFEKAKKAGKNLLTDITDNISYNLKELMNKSKDGKRTFKKKVNKIKDIIYAYAQPLFQYFLELDKKDVYEIMGKFKLSKLYDIASTYMTPFLSTVATDITNGEKKIDNIVSETAISPEKDKYTQLAVKASGTAGQDLEKTLKEIDEPGKSYLEDIANAAEA